MTLRLSSHIRCLGCIIIGLPPPNQYARIRQDHWTSCGQRDVYVPRSVMSTPTSSTTSSPQARLNQLSGHMSTQTATAFAAVSQAPSDPLFGLAQECRNDSDPRKIDLGIGAYRNQEGKPWVLPVVKKAEKLLATDPNLNHEYLPIAGLPEFTKASQKLVLGADSPAISEKRVTSLQTISGTGAVHLGALFLGKFYNPADPLAKTVYVSNPTWANHLQICSTVNMPTKTYSYWQPKTRGLDFDGMISALKTAPEGSIILLHACAHNPTGVDPTKEQWKAIAEVMKSRKQIPYMDTAYQGFASGNLEQDAWAIRYFVEQGFEMLIAQSYAKNFGLYGERAGCFHFITAPGPQAADITTRVASQLAILQRSEISNPPIFGARIASLVLNDKGLFAEWEKDLQTMSGRIKEMRAALRSELEKLGTPGTWNHITDQIGMFSFTGLTQPQVQKLKSQYHIYLTNNGRISMAGLNTSNVAYFAKSVDAVVRGS